MGKRVSFRKRLRRLEVRLQRNPRIQRAIRCAYARYVRFVERTTRWQYLGIDAYGPNGDHRPAVMCAWHSQLSCTPYLGPLTHRTCKVLASDHADGQIVLDFLQSVGVEAILIQTSRNKTQGLKAALAALKAGDTLGLTPDGPLGPAEQSKPGAIILASLAGVPIIPIGYAAKPALRLPTWDRFILPLPFGRGILSAGPAVNLPRKLDEEQITAACKDLDASLRAETARCEDALSRPRPKA